MSATRSVPPRWYAAIYAQVLMAVALAVLLGLLAPHLAVALKPLGDGFIRLVKMIIAPVIFCTVAGGIAGVNSLEKVGRVGLKSLLYFIAVSSLACCSDSPSPIWCSRGAGLNADPAQFLMRRGGGSAVLRAQPQCGGIPAAYHSRHPARRLYQRRDPAGCCWLPSCSAAPWP